MICSIIYCESAECQAFKGGLRIQFGISEQRAKELEDSLTTLQLTEEEQEYLNEYKEIIVDGEITEKERRLLNKILKLNGISQDRAREIEASVK